MVEVDVGEHGDLGRARAATVRSDSSPSTTSQPRPACVRAQLRHLGAESRVEPEAVEAEGDHRRRGRLPVHPGDDHRPLQRHELGEEVGARAAGHAIGVRGGDDNFQPSGGSGGEERATGGGAPESDTACPPGPSRTRRPAKRARAARRPRGRHRRSRRTRCAYPRVAARPISSSAIVSAASGRASPRIASFIEVSRARPEASAHQVGDGVELRLRDDHGATGALEVAGVLRLMVAGREVARVPAPPAARRPRAPRPTRRRARARDLPRRARRRSPR